MEKRQFAAWSYIRATVEPAERLGAIDAAYNTALTDEEREVLKGAVDELVETVKRLRPGALFSARQAFEIIAVVSLWRAVKEKEEYHVL